MELDLPHRHSFLPSFGPAHNYSHDLSSDYQLFSSFINLTSNTQGNLFKGYSTISSEKTNHNWIWLRGSRCTSPFFFSVHKQTNAWRTIRVHQSHWFPHYHLLSAACNSLLLTWALQNLPPASMLFYLCFLCSSYYLFILYFVVSKYASRNIR